VALQQPIHAALRPNDASFGHRAEGLGGTTTATAIQGYNRALVERSRTSEDIHETLAAKARQSSDALLTLEDPLTFQLRSTIATFASAQRLCAMHPYREFVEVGGLMSYGPDHVDLFRRAADFVDKILKGSKPEDLPVEQPTKFELFSNSIPRRLWA